MNVAVVGASGHMGQLVCQTVVAHPDLALHARIGRAGPQPGDLDVDVVIDFSLPAGTAALIPMLTGQALVSGTTGLSDAQRADLEAYAQRGPLLWASNFSTGMTLLLRLVEQAAAALPDTDVEIVEMHHGRKRDAPSGTALSLGRRAAHARGWTLDDTAVHGRAGAVGQRPAREIGFHAVRGGDVAGEHTVILAGSGERLQLNHLATSRQAFASGAVRAAAWIIGKPPGRYTMGDVLGL